jgi:hypothetical protein
VARFPLYEALTGSHLNLTTYHLLHGPPPSISEITPSLQPQLAHLPACGNLGQALTAILGLWPTLTCRFGGGGKRLYNSTWLNRRPKESRPTGDDSYISKMNPT